MDYGDDLLYPFPRQSPSSWFNHRNRSPNLRPTADPPSYWPHPLDALDSVTNQMGPVSCQALPSPGSPFSNTDRPMPELPRDAPIFIDRVNLVLLPTDHNSTRPVTITPLASMEALVAALGTSSQLETPHMTSPSPRYSSSTNDPHHLQDNAQQQISNSTNYRHVRQSQSNTPLRCNKCSSDGLHVYSCRYRCQHQTENSPLSLNSIRG